MWNQAREKLIFCGTYNENCIRYHCSITLS
uniref:Uncharacterized protein n=1 Tax=Rhizophora mucronata TaxID=61149 RepID=A0A2P2NJG0_RHIMU